MGSGRSPHENRHPCRGRLRLGIAVAGFLVNNKQQKEISLKDIGKGDYSSNVLM